MEIKREGNAHEHSLEFRVRYVHLKLVLLLSFVTDSASRTRCNPFNPGYVPVPFYEPSRPLPTMTTSEESRGLRVRPLLPRSR